MFKNIKYIFILLAFGLISCTETPLFEVLKADKTNITFENKLTESEEMNILSYEYFYNGGGVAAGDFNNDGLVDLYFSGNQVPSKLYLNKGNLKFEELKFDFESPSGAWKTGVSLVDINNDGWLDIYQCYSGLGSNEKRKNKLFINNINNPPPRGGQGGALFVESAEQYGIADVGYSTHATFFDYDLDGDLDLFVLNHNLKNYQRKEAAQMKASVDELAGDRLYRSPLAPRGGISSKSKEPILWGKEGFVFEDVTKLANIKSNPLGFGLGVVVSDFNHDNYPDLFVANDYVEEDYLYLNNQNGTFLEVGKEAMGHFSYSSMGVDAADINNDGLTDIFTADMLPEDNARQKLLAFPDNWNVQQSMLQNGFHWQNMRNMLQINLGERRKEKGERKNSLPIGEGWGGAFFSEIGQLAGISATDWSWSPLFADFDNDGFKDLFVSNGFVRDLTDLDFAKYVVDEETKAKQNLPSESLLQMAKKMPSTPTHHFIFKNNGDLTFKNQVQEWGVAQNTIACGAIYADLDNDGDLEIITNNTNESATIYKNNSQEQSPKNFLKIKFKGNQSIGNKVFVYTNGTTQFYENYPTHGFQSSVIDALHIGLGDAKKVDSIKVVWANGQSQKIGQVPVNQLFTIDFKDLYSEKNIEINSIFNEISLINQSFKINTFNDFNRQILLPKLYSKQGFKLTKGDVNGDGLEDIFSTDAGLFIQKPNGSFELSKSIFSTQKHRIDATFIDIDNDKDLDLYIANGGYEQVLEDKINEDELYLNDGKGNFTLTQNKTPSILTNKSAVKVIDFDNDKDADLFISGGVRAGLYPYGDPSYLLKNDGKGNFTIAQKLELGLLNDVVIADFNKDKWLDIIAVGEFTNIQLLSNQKGKFNEKPENLAQNGWYNRIGAEDLDKDGDLDLVVGNLGMNTPLQASIQKPLQLLFGDADGNFIVDLFMANYVGEKAYPIAGRDELLEQSVFLKRKFTDYKSYSKATIDELLDPEMASKMTKLTIENLKTGILWNNGGKFDWQDLPTLAQASPIYAIHVQDFNNDGIKDLILAGNESNFRIRIGKTDANMGLILLGQKDKSFKPIPQNQAGLYLRGDVRDILQINNRLFFSEVEKGISGFERIR
jgi:enediyne biosynthesis protein E4